MTSPYHERKQETSLCLIFKADRMFVQPKNTYHFELLTQINQTLFFMHKDKKSG
jgi:hypothetical protein